MTERAEGVPAWVLLSELFVGLGWLRATVEKLIDPYWWDGSVIASFIVDHSRLTLGWYRPIIDHLVGPNIDLYVYVVIVAQLATAVSLISGRFVGYGVMIGMFMNLNFLAAGAVNPSVFYLLIQGALGLWLAEHVTAGKGIPRRLSAIAIGAYVFAIMSLPSIRTVHPAEVMEDPGVMFFLIGVLTVVGCDQAHRRITRTRGLPVLNWLFKRQENTVVTVEIDDQVLVLR